MLTIGFVGGLNAPKATLVDAMQTQDNNRGGVHCTLRALVDGNV